MMARKQGTKRHWREELLGVFRLSGPPTDVVFEPSPAQSQFSVDEEVMLVAALFNRTHYLRVTIDWGLVMPPGHKQHVTATVFGDRGGEYREWSAWAPTASEALLDLVCKITGRQS